MSLTLTRRASLLSLAAAALPFPAQAAKPDPAAQDREAILKMAGDFKVRFDFRETAVFAPGYQPIPEKLSGGHESVRVIADEPHFVSLQHMLVAEMDKEIVVVKHWRQDWTYEPRDVLVYAAKDQWRVRPVSAGERKGAWSQTVWQTDDSPRYGGVGRWAHRDGVSRWTSDVSLRPLARRDAIRHPVYDHYEGVNRHAITPDGWVHEQDNSKIGMKDGRPVTFVHEDGINTYTRFNDYPVVAADEYWAATSAYWAAVRAQWDKIIAARKGVRLQEEADNGSITGARLMDLADEIKSGAMKTEQAIAQAQDVIAASTPA